MADPKPFLRSGLITLLAGISATAAFAATGFISEFGREQLLGINLTDWSTQTLVLLAGRCAADSFFLLLSFMARHAILLSFLVVLVASTVILLRHRKFPDWVAPAAECALAVPLSIWCLLIIVTFEGPTIPLRGWIISPDDHMPLSTAISELHPKNALRANPGPDGSVQSLAPGSSGAHGASRLSDFSYTTQPDAAGVLLLQSASDELGKRLATIGFPYHPHFKARAMLYGRYAAAVAGCLLALLYVLISYQCPASKLWGDLLTVLRCLVLVFSGIATLLLPYVYGKLVDSTLFPNAYVTYEQPPTDGVAGKPTLVSGEYPVIGHSDSSISLLWVQAHGGRTQIIEVPTSKVISLEYVADVDVLAKISKCTVNPETECQ